MNTAKTSNGNVMGKAVRIAATAACMAMSVFVTSPKPAEACFVQYTKIDDCNWVADYVCSYHSNGTGGYYVARSGIVANC